jgi:hypothetical protein
MSMNYFYDLPEELQEKIHFECHLGKFCNVAIELVNETPIRGAEYSMQYCLYNTTMDKKELRDYFFCLDWLDGKKLKITSEDMEHNVYYNVFNDYWDQVREQEYYNGDYI